MIKPVSCTFFRNSRWQRFGQFLNDFFNDFLYENINFLYENHDFLYENLNFLYENLRFSL